MEIAIIADYTAGGLILKEITEKDKKIANEKFGGRLSDYLDDYVDKNVGIGYWFILNEDYYVTGDKSALKELKKRFKKIEKVDK
jgi:hypothetical protein